MTLNQLRTALEARATAAHARAAVIASGIEFQKGGANRRSWQPSADRSYFRFYYRRNPAKRLAGGDRTVERFYGIAVCSVLVLRETGEETTGSIVEAIRQDFLTASDGLQFDEAPAVRDGRDSGAHWITVAEFPFYVDTTRQVA